MANTGTINRNQLPIGTVVDGYAIQKLLGSGGFSLIYLGEDLHDLSPVVIKQFLPERFTRKQVDENGAARKDQKPRQIDVGRDHFYEEAKALAALHHPNIVNVRSFFCIDESAFLVMDYHTGKNLATYVKEQQGGLSEEFLLKVFPPLLDALRLIHSKSFLHLDIKPANIHVRPGGHPLLLDFGAVHQMSRGKRLIGPVVTPGFAPVEQYYSSGNVGPWSDLYAIGATMRACIEGKPPPPAIRRDADDDPFGDG